MHIDVHFSLKQNLPAQFKLKMVLEYAHIRVIICPQRGEPNLKCALETYSTGKSV